MSIASALHCGKLCAPFIFEGSCNRDVFETYVEKVLVPILTPGKTIVLDNATFHHGGKILQLIEKSQCKVLYLPPYSPDYNPIEHFWTCIKNTIRRQLNDFSMDLYQAACNSFESVLV